MHRDAAVSMGIAGALLIALPGPSAAGHGFAGMATLFVILAASEVFHAASSMPGPDVHLLTFPVAPALSRTALFYRGFTRARRERGPFATGRTA